MPPAPHDLTDAEIDQLLEQFDRSPVRLQRRAIARLIADRALLLETAKEVLTGWNRAVTHRLLEKAVELVERPGEES